MKRILLSLSIIILAGALVGGTAALFSDTETSTGNVFTAGALDLTVDHTYASYNGEECLGSCDVDVYSNTVDVVNGLPASLTWVHSAWTDIDDAYWIWDDYYVQDPQNDEQYVFTKTFGVTGVVSEAVFEIAADNGYKLVINGTIVIDDLADEYNYSSVDDYDVSSLLVAGDNDIEITVKNFGLEGAGPTQNPAGVIYRLQVKSNCGGGYTETPGAYCQLWMEQNLDTETFFNFDDVKPGDWGVNVISLHVDDNDAHACIIVHDEENLENSLEDPEVEADDPGIEEGELEGEIEIFAWEDENQNGYYDDGEEDLYGVGPLDSELIQLALIGGGPTEYVGLVWCAGDLYAEEDENFECNGAGMGNIAQTDSLTASLTAYAEQTRNNPNFSCEDVDLDEDPQDQEST